MYSPRTASKEISESREWLSVAALPEEILQSCRFTKKEFKSASRLASLPLLGLKIFSFIGLFKLFLFSCFYNYMPT